jgi:uncharacterized protein (DUF849 family)
MEFVPRRFERLARKSRLGIVTAPDEITAVLERAGLRRPILLHGFDATVWLFVELARQRRWSTRVGLEDGNYLPDGTMASDNAALVTAAIAIFRATPLQPQWRPDG